MKCTVSILACMLFFSCSSGYQYASYDEEITEPGDLTELEEAGQMDAELIPVSRGALLQKQDRVKGMPGFDRNVLQCLYARYALIEDAHIVADAELYFYTGPLFFSSRVWIKDSLDSRNMYLREQNGILLIALDIHDIYEAGTLFLVLASEKMEGERQLPVAFIRSFSGRFSYFMNRVTTLDGVSFPAVLEW